MKNMFLHEQCAARRMRKVFLCMSVTILRCMKTVVFSSFSNGENTHMACCEKYKPYILKYKALISKYMPYIFDEKWYLIFNDLQEWKNMRFQAWILPLSGSFG